MNRVLRGLIHAGAWTLATGAAVTLSWFGVHTVVSGTAYDPPRALPISDNAPGAQPESESGAAPRASSTHRPKPSGTPSPSPTRQTTRPEEPAAPPHTPAPSRSATAPDGGGDGDAGTVRSYRTDGGRVVLDLKPSHAELVSATPGPGWQMQVWKQDGWLRVDFTRGNDHTSVISAWNGHPPVVTTDNHAQ
ncbi:hypothetical protein [Streptomyces purpurogeneiscleroticus]|uniref:hypothetical protein n=1 Tax=Streptomyces purpurogeneiscleroticus TaxID=68259 RepID=UPI001CBF5B64|nr:hypothetical protein [Streptomyces purpurogeneiscleroticus]